MFVQTHMRMIVTFLQVSTTGLTQQCKYKPYRSTSHPILFTMYKLEHKP
uniref:Uncharacterized protein n=1 Tax=Ciona intestinalis TaxID=7719 RepID=H2XZT0_CIOIN